MIYVPHVRKLILGLQMFSLCSLFLFYVTALEVCGLDPNRTICYNNGSCVNNVCSCSSQYTGPSCQYYVCELNEGVKNVV